MSAWTRRIHVLGISVAAGLLFAGDAAAEVVLHVNSVLDQLDDDTTDGVCHTAANTCTLRAAVMQANKISGAGTTILLPAGTYTLTRPASGANGDDNGDLNLTNPTSGTPVIAISGGGAGATIIDANQLDRVFRVEVDRTATISGVTIRNGLADVIGGIFNQGTLTVSYCKVIDNSSIFQVGGGIGNSGGYLTVSHTTVSGNSATSAAGIFNDGNSLAYVIQSTISDNTAFYEFGGGGGIFNDGFLFVINSTISGNDTYGSGGGIFNAPNGQTDVYNSTIVFNQADAEADSTGSGGGIYNNGGIFILRNSVFAGNYRSQSPGSLPDDCQGDIASQGRNKVWAAVGLCEITQFGPGDVSLLSSLAELGPLQSHGGPTATHALVAPSDMIDGAEATEGCLGPSGLLTTDQRGGPRSAGVRCDIGAFEYQGLPANLIFADGVESGNLWAWN